MAGSSGGCPWRLLPCCPGLSWPPGVWPFAPCLAGRVPRSVCPGSAGSLYLWTQYLPLRNLHPWTESAPPACLGIQDWCVFGGGPSALPGEPGSVLPRLAGSWIQAVPALGWRWQVDTNGLRTYRVPLPVRLVPHPHAPPPHLPSRGPGHSIHSGLPVAGAAQWAGLGGQAWKGLSCLAALVLLGCGLEMTCCGRYPGKRKGPCMSV